MDKNMIGNMVNYERTRKKINLQVLVEGISSVSVMQRLENGERIPDFFVLERIIERLGRSINKIEFLYSKTVYELYFLRVLIERYIEEKNYIEAESALAYYESLKAASETLHRQFIYKYKAIIFSEKEVNHEDAMHYFKMALEMTVPNFYIKNLETRLLGEEELTILLLWMQECIEIDPYSFELDGDSILRYIETHYEDEEVKVNIYSKAVWVIGTWAIKQNNYQEALQYTLRGEQILTENKVLLHMPQYLERILFLTKENDAVAYREWKKQRDALKYLYEEYEKTWNTDSCEIWKHFRQQEVFLVSELFEQERNLLKQSQEGLADELDMDQKTISRLESGKYKPKEGTLEKLRAYFTIDRDVCSTRIVVEDFHLLEMERQIAKLNEARRGQEAEFLYKKLKSQLSMQWNENKQYVKYMDTLFASKQGKISWEEAISACMEAFHITRKGVCLDNVAQVILSRFEAFILNYMAVSYDNMGDKCKAIEIAESILQGYEKSKVDLRYHYAAVTLVASNLSDWYEEAGRFDDAIVLCDEIIKLELECNRGVHIGYLLSERRFAMDRKQENQNLESKDIYKKAYQILKLMKSKQRMLSLEKTYLKWYKETIN